MVNPLKHLSGAIRILGQDGAMRLMSNVVVRFAPRSVVQYWNRDPEWQGLLVEFAGNRSRLDGALIDLDNPHVSRGIKSRFFRGTYEQPERWLASRYLPGNLPVIEIGGCLGVMGCITNRKLKNPEKHLVVEANPHMIGSIEKNRELNLCRFKIVHAALAYGSDKVVFHLNELCVGGSVQRATGKSVEVATCTLQSLAAAAEGFDRFNLLCDVEGAEIDLIRHEPGFLSNHVEWLLVDMHDFIVGREQVEWAHSVLRDGGFEEVDRFNNERCYRNRGLLS